MAMAFGLGGLLLTIAVIVAMQMMKPEKRPEPEPVKKDPAGQGSDKQPGADAGLADPEPGLSPEERERRALERQLNETRDKIAGAARGEMPFSRAQGALTRLKEKVREMGEKGAWANEQIGVAEGELRTAMNDWFDAKVIPFEQAMDEEDWEAAQKIVDELKGTPVRSRTERLKDLERRLQDAKSSGGSMIGD